MNTKGNQRFIETDKKIQEVFQDLLEFKDLDRITVREICERAGVHRTTFYKHYLDVSDLLEKRLLELGGNIIQEFYTGESFSFTRGYTALFACIRDNQTLFMACLHHPQSFEKLLEMMNDMESRHKEKVAAYVSDSYFENAAYHRSFFLCGLIGMAIAWVKGGCQETPGQMANLINEEYSLKRY